MWEAIKYAKELGLKSFGFKDSVIPQINRYFKGLGQSTLYYRKNKAKLPLEILFK